MIRIILGVIAGLIVWTIMWVGGEQVLSMLSPSWFGAHQVAFERAVFNTEPFTVENSILVVNLVRGMIVTLIAGYLAALVAGENRVSPLILGVVLLFVGIYVAWFTWAMIPVWYHALFTLMLIPVTVWGARLRTSREPVST